MIKSGSLVLILLCCVFGGGTPIAYAQSSGSQTSTGSTEQTDKAEEDWRRSKKKPDKSGVFEDIINRRTQGWGIITPSTDPIDRLPEASQRHLLKERAKVMAIHDPNNIPDVPYTPSSAAKADTDLAQQEKDVWEGMMKDLKQSSAQGQNSNQNSDPPSNQGSSSQDQSGQGQTSSSSASPGDAAQSDGASSSSSSSSASQRSQTPSTMRGGSASSVAEILAGIKGTSPNSPPSGTSSNRQSANQDTSSHSASSGASQSSQQDKSDGQTSSNSMSGSQSSGEANSSGEAQATNPKAAQNAEGQGQNGAVQSSGLGQTPSPLDQLGTYSPQGETQGRSASASDYLKHYQIVAPPLEEPETSEDSSNTHKD